MYGLNQGGAIRSYLLMKGFVVRTMLLSVCFLLCKLEVNNQCNQSPIESRNWNFLAFYEKVCWYNLNSIEKTVLRSNGLCQTWYYSQFGFYDNSTGVDKIEIPQNTKRLLPGCQYHFCTNNYVEFGILSQKPILYATAIVFVKNWHPEITSFSNI